LEGEDYEGGSDEAEDELRDEPRQGVVVDFGGGGFAAYWVEEEWSEVATAVWMLLVWKHGGRAQGCGLTFGDGLNKASCYK
jgi:hypothetical protein